MSAQFVRLCFNDLIVVPLRHIHRTHWLIENYDIRTKISQILNRLNIIEYTVKMFPHDYHVTNNNRMTHNLHTKFASRPHDNASGAQFVSTLRDWTRRNGKHVTSELNTRDIPRDISEHPTDHSSILVDPWASCQLRKIAGCARMRRECRERFPSSSTTKKITR